MSTSRNLESFGIIAATNPPDPSKLPAPDLTSKVTWRYVFLGTKIPWYHKCGHPGFIGFSVMVKGAQSYKQWFSRECPDCFIRRLDKDVITCALCGLYITPGDGVALYNAKHPEVNTGFAHTIKDADGEWALGCLRCDCCPGGGFFSGNWMGAEDGFQPYDYEKNRT